MRAMFFTSFAVVWFSSVLFGDEQRTVTVVGTAESTVRPDTAILSLGIIARNRQLIAAKSTVDGLIKDVGDAIEKVGVKRDAIRTSSIDYSTIFSDDDQEYADPVYRVGRDISVTVPIGMLDPVLQSATKAGANQITEIRYTSSSDVEESRKTLSMAIANAKENASFLATAFDAKLGKAIKIQSDRSGYPANLSIVVSATQDPFGGESYVPDEITITRTITVIFELTD